MKIHNITIKNTEGINMFNIYCPEEIFEEELDKYLKLMNLKRDDIEINE